MIATDLQPVADAVVRKARQQGYVLPREVREELTQAGHPEGLWKDVLALARSSLSYRSGRYHYVSPLSARVRQERKHQQGIRRATRLLIRQYKSGKRADERRSQQRIDFVQPVQVQAEDGREFTLVTRDLSPTGIRLLGTRRLLGQKVRVRVALGNGEGSWCFVVRILWTCAVGEDLFENGGMFLEVEQEDPAPE